MLVNSISSFLAEHGISFHMDKIDGHLVIFTDRRTPIFPISICSSNTEEASISAKESQQVVDRICDMTGEYPLVITEDRWKAQGQTVGSSADFHSDICTQLRGTQD